MSRWYRAYEGTVSDPKLAEAALVAGCSRSVAIAAWHLTLENAAAVNDGGRVDIPTRRIAAALCEPFADIETLFGAFEAIGLVVDSHVTAWKRRQYESDNSTERSRKRREKLKDATCNGDATLHNANASPPKTETETEDSVANATGGEPPTAVDAVKIIFASGRAILKDAGLDERQAGSIIGRLRKNYTDPLVLTLISRCEVLRPSDPVGWLTKNAELEHQKLTGTRNGQHSSNRGSTTQDIGQRAALRLAAGPG